jgi:amino acid transporter
MSEREMTAKQIKPTLGLTGAAMNAMALIAPGAFLWITYQIQASATIPSGASAATSMWAGILVALVLAFLTALSYAELARIYPEAGFASCAYFAEKAFLDARKEKRAAPTSLARLSKLVTGWAAHLFYWVYPGVMVAMFAILVGYIWNAVTGQTLSATNLTIIGVIFAFIVGFIAFKGVQGSTKVNIAINIIQWVAILVFSGLAIWYRISNPEHTTAWTFTGAFDIVKFHNIQAVLVQSTIAILILVGFESATSMSAETKDPGKNIPKAILIALFVQGVLAYLFEYFAANLMVSDKLTGTVTIAATKTAAATTQIVKGMDAMAASSAPIGDMSRLLGDHLLGGIGFGLMITMAITVVIAVIGTTLSCMNTAVRVTNGMAADRELPDFLSFLHTKNKTPHTTIWVLVVISCVIAAIGIQSVVGLTGITLASNFGTFVLYGLVCVWTIVAFAKRKDFNLFRHGLIPGLGLLMNVLMLVGIIYLNVTGTSDNKTEAKICFYIAGGFALVSFLYVMVTTVKKNYSMKMITVMTRPEKLGILVSVLKEEALVHGMTVSKVKGFGRTYGKIDPVENESIETKISFVPKVKVDVVVNDWDVPHVLSIMQEVLKTGKSGDGKIFVLDAKEALRVSSGETGVEAV